MDDDELKDWEVRDEVPPEKLSRKWESEDREGGVPPVRCRNCGQMTPQTGLSCVFCGTTVYTQSGLLGRMLSGLRKWFSK